MPDHTIKLKIDNSDAQRASQQTGQSFAKLRDELGRFVASGQQGFKQLADAVALDFKGIADTQSAWINKVLTQDEVAQQAMLRRVHATNEARIKAAIQASEAETGGLGLAEQAANNFSSALTNIALQAVSVQAALGFVRTIADAMEDAHRSAIDMAKQLGQVGEDLREIAQLRNKVAPDDDEIRKYVQLRQETGLTHAQAVSFTTEIESGAAGVSEAKLPRAERERLVTLGGQFAARVSKDDTGVSNRARILGLLPGFLPGQVSAQQVVGTADVAEQILAAGSGSNTQLAAQYQKVLTSITSQGLAGFSRNPLEAASLTAIASKFNPEEAATSTVEALRELRGFTRFRKTPGIDASQAGTLGRAGINEFDAPIQAMTKLFRLIDQETKGGKAEAVDAYLGRQGFRNLTGNQRIAQFFEQYQQGEFQRITGMAQGPIDVNAPGRKFEAFAATDTGRGLLATARTDAARLGVGQFYRPLQLAAQEAEAPAIAAGLDTDAGQLLNRRLMGVGMFSQQAARQAILEQQGIEQQRKQLGLPEQFMLPSQQVSQFGMLGNLPFIGSRFNTMMGSMTGATAVDAQMLKKLEELAEINRKQLETMKAPQQPTPAGPKPPLNVPKPSAQPKRS